MSSAIAQQPAPSETVGQFLRRTKKLLIGGEWTDSASSTEIAVYDPATEEQITAVPDANAADVERAVAAARKALESGPWPQREALLWPLSDLIDEHFDELCELESLDNGKTRFMASIIDVPGARNCFRYMAGWATKVEGSTLDVSAGPL